MLLEETSHPKLSDPYFIMIPKSYMQECFIDVSIGIELHNFSLCLVVVLGSCVCLLQREASLIIGEGYTYPWV